MRVVNPVSSTRLVGLAAMACGLTACGGAPAAAPLGTAPPSTTATVTTPPLTLQVSGKETGRVTFEHPTWGRSTLVTSFRRDADSDPGTGYITVFGADGGKVWEFDTGDQAWYEMRLHKPAMDTTGQIFVEWNPGRYNGVTILQPVPGGFADHRTLMASGDYAARFYGADVKDVDGDGDFEIVEGSNDCTPTCAEGTSTYTAWLWNGQDYVNR